MHKNIPLITLLTITSLSHAGEVPVAATNSNPDAFSYLTPTLDLRSRFEFREQDGLDASTAFTTRARFGLLSKEFSGFSAFVEGEGNIVMGDDYRSNPTGNTSTYPYVAGNTVISDPRNFELNQAWLQFKNDGFHAKIGRQRIIRNSAAFIGNVGWRQNEQTFDAAEIGYSNQQFSLTYAYSDRVQRIFGDDANDGLPGPPLHDFEGDFHLLDFDCKIDGGSLGGYLYLIDVENNAAVGESNTLGAFYKSGPLYAEFAFQEGESSNAKGMDYEALYGHVKYTHQAGNASFTGGVEYLGEDFKTPLATVHAYNGFADAFVLQRIGLTNSGGAYDGITDFYVGYTQKGLPCGIVFKGFLHYFMDDSLSGSYGYEADAVFIKAFSKQLKGIVKAAYFKADDDGPFSDIKQVSMELNYSF